MTKRFVLALLMVGLFAASAAAQTIGPGASFTWDQDAADLATAQSYLYQLRLDGVDQPLTTTVCSGATSPFLCNHAVPAMSNGSHTASVRATQIIAGVVYASLDSNSVSFVYGQAPAVPRQFRVIPASTAQLVTPPPQ